MQIRRERSKEESVHREVYLKEVDDSVGNNQAVNAKRVDLGQAGACD